MKFSVITIFPDLITSYTDESIVGRAQEDGQISVEVYDPRNYTDDKHDSIDGPPYGGGPGMVMEAKPILRAVEAAQENSQFTIQNSQVFLMSARGQQFDREMAQDIKNDLKHAIIICGRYEGIDQRVVNALDPELVSAGPYVLSGGELPALVMVDAVSRNVDGVLGNEASLESDREAAGAPVYTRPKEIEHGDETYDVPSVLLSGHHEKIRQWRIRNAKSKNQNSKNSQ
ncbi:MAG: tRNA (guanosine(37)-N1)-methyltransferase TrmD [Parcubacteria group bacterium SW_6_46_9]|nr:MAG: tRNA (guanosine(37)-N1)-methyltransferase TrmD [Parcubacteria group bacterium SW_6_46_9]